MMLRMKTREVQEHNSHVHAANHRRCVGFCSWGFSNLKHGVEGKGGLGKAGRRKYLARGMKYMRPVKEKKA